MVQLFAFHSHVHDVLGRPTGPLVATLAP
jgi:hypothetical protein